MFNKGVGESFGELCAGVWIKNDEISKGKRQDVSVGYPLSQGTNSGHGEHPATVGDRSACTAASHLYLGKDPASPHGDHSKSLQEIW